MAGATAAGSITGLETTNLRRVTMRRSISGRGWLRSGGAILVVCSLAACAGAGQPSASAAVASSPSPSVSIAALPSVAPIPAAEQLAAALAPLLEASAFESSVTVDGQVAVTSSGRSVGGATELTVTTSGTVVDYVQIPPRAWARESGGLWVLVAEAEAPGSPLTVLAAPTTLLVDPTGAATLVATYPAVALGLEGDAVTVTITLGAAVTFRYQGEAGGHATVSETIIHPAANREPITAPA